MNIYELEELFQPEVEAFVERQIFTPPGSTVLDDLHYGQRFKFVDHYGPDYAILYEVAGIYIESNHILIRNVENLKKEWAYCKLPVIRYSL
jgi:hypothetical protein